MCCPTDIRKTHFWCFGEDAIFHGPCGPKEEFYGAEPTVWREWPSCTAGCNGIDGIGQSNAMTPTTPTNEAPAQNPSTQSPATETSQPGNPFKDDSPGNPPPVKATMDAPQSGTAVPLNPSQPTLDPNVQPSDLDSNSSEQQLGSPGNEPLREQDLISQSNDAQQLERSSPPLIETPAQHEASPNEQNSASPIEQITDSPNEQITASPNEQNTASPNEQITASGMYPQRHVVVQQDQSASHASHSRRLEPVTAPGPIEEERLRTLQPRPVSPRAALLRPYFEN